MMAVTTLNETDSSIYEKIIPRNENLPKNTPQIPKQSRKGAAKKSTCSQLQSSEPNKFGQIKSKPSKASPDKINSTQKTMVPNFPAKKVSQVTKSLKIIAATLLIGLFVLSVAAGLIIYFLAVKPGEEKSTTLVSMTTPLSVKKSILAIPEIWHISSFCDLVARLAEFEFDIYGSNVWNAVGVFFEIKVKYFSQENLKSKRQNFDIGFEELRNLSKSMSKFHEDRRDSFEKYVGLWINCVDLKKNFSKCEYESEQFRKPIKSIAKNSKEAKDVATALDRTFRRIRHEVFNLNILHQQGETLLQYLVGFIAYFQSLEVISNFLNKKIARYSYSNLGIAYMSIQFAGNLTKELACLTIAEDTFFKWTEPIKDFLRYNLEGEVKMATAKANSTINGYRQLAKHLRNNWTETRNSIVEKWHKKVKHGKLFSNLVNIH